ncbi:MAG TPA: 2-C-methyl-D-erythritol 4-phosphate cytidylyltransferase [Acidimicrobiia bacterium]|nr:2-C-methyl-D-erythritol 4-phosphate cytidylyltransferase [Acidimicrobiia bacterium]
MGEVWAIVVAGGSGSRFGGGVLKQFLDLGGRPLIDWAVAAAAGTCDGVVVVLPDDHLAADPLAADHLADAPLPAAGAPAASGEGPPPRRCTAVAGGPSRAASVRAGLAAVPVGADIVVVHDAARPLAGPGLFERVVAAVRAGADGAVPGVPVPDTIKRVDSGDGRAIVVETLDRPTLRAVQTPQAFRADVLRRAHAGGGDATDDAALVEALGATVVVVEGDPANLKITTADDLVRAEVLLDRRDA